MAYDFELERRALVALSKGDLQAASEVRSDLVAQANWLGKALARYIEALEQGKQPPITITERLVFYRRLQVDLQALISEIPEKPAQPRSIALFCMPKSGSTYLETLLSTYLDLTRRESASSNELSGVGFDPSLWLSAMRTNNSVVRSHSVASLRVLALLTYEDVKPVILVRDIFDALESMVDYHEYRVGSLFGTELGYANFSAEQKRQHTILRYAQYYVDFFVTWISAARKLGWLVLDYDTVTKNPAETVHRIVSYTGVAPARQQDLSAIIDHFKRGIATEAGRQKVRFNVGVAGRGSAFSAAQRQIVRSLYDQFPKIDFSPVDREWRNDRPE